MFTRFYRFVALCLMAGLSFSGCSKKVVKNEAPTQSQTSDQKPDAQESEQVEQSEKMDQSEKAAVPLSEYGDTERQNYCEEWNHWRTETFGGTRHKESNCYARASSDMMMSKRMTAQDCQQQFATCMQSEWPPEREGFYSECPKPELYDGCQATIEEIRACLDALEAQKSEQHRAFEKVGCEGLVQPGQREELILTRDDEPEACRSVEAKCPNF